MEPGEIRCASSWRKFHRLKVGGEMQGSKGPAFLFGGFAAHSHRNMNCHLYLRRRSELSIDGAAWVQREVARFELFAVLRLLLRSRLLGGLLLYSLWRFRGVCHFRRNFNELTFEETQATDFSGCHDDGRFFVFYPQHVGSLGYRL